jgi:Zn-dependent protease
LRHIDPIGTVMVPILTLTLSMVAGGLFVFGWAKPVPVNFGALRHPKKDMLWVSLAGPAANLFMALVWGLAARMAMELGDNYFAQPLYDMASIGIQINAVLLVLNLLPLPPLDGGRIAVSLLPMPQAVQFARLEPYGMLILIVLLATQVLGAILWPVVNLVNSTINFIFGI